MSGRDLNHSVSALSQEDIARIERAYFETHPQGVRRLVVEVFGRPTSKVMKQIFADNRYFDLASRERGNFYFMGYQGSTLTPDAFSDAAFIQAHADLEDRTSWEYSGETDLVILNSHLESTGSVELLYEEALCLTLERAISAKAVDSIPSYFQTIIRNMNTSDSESVGHLSDHAAKKFVKSGLTKLLLALLPKDLRSDAERAFFHCVRDISPTGR